MRNLLAVGLLAAAGVVAASDVHDLKTDTFKPFVEEHDLVLAECECRPQYSKHARVLTRVQSSPRGAVTARHSLLSTKKLQQA